jgi:hypothetical protein
MTRIVPPVLTSVHPAPPALRYWMGMARRIIGWVREADRRNVTGEADLTGGCSIQRATAK